MRFTCPKRVFHEALQSVSRAIATRSTLPILGNVLLEARDGQLKLVTTDLEIGMTCLVPLDDMQAGSVTVPERIIQDVVGNLPDAEITVSADERNLLTVSAAKAEYTIHGLPSEEFPVLPQVPTETVLSIPGPVLRDLVRKTLFAASTDESRVILTGCLLTWDGEKATMVATDTHRLAVKRVPATGRFQQAVSVIIPSRALQELLRLLGNTENPVDVSVGESQVLFSVGRVQLVTRLIEGQFPAFERVIPAESTKHLVANRQQLLEAVHRASIVARAESNKVILRAEDNNLRITAETTEVGKAIEDIPISLDGDAVEIAFNAEYLQDVLSVLDSETVDLGLTGPLNPGLIQADGEADYQYVVMPMQMI
ncbi:MAG TPA: DNA polymerase III subunit beta [Armatimonadota bacterium]